MQPQANEDGPKRQTLLRGRPSCHMAFIGDQIDIEVCNRQFGPNRLTFTDHSYQTEPCQFLQRPGNVGLRPTGKLGQTGDALRTIPADDLKKRAVSRGQNPKQVRYSISFDRPGDIPLLTTNDGSHLFPKISQCPRHHLHSAWPHTPDAKPEAPAIG